MKRGIYLLFLILFCPAVFSIAISPSSYVIDFEPNLEQTLQFRVADVDQQLMLNLEGELAKYVTVEQETLSGAGIFNVFLKFPDKIDVPGKHSIFVNVVESSESGGTISARAGIKALIIVNVPFDGKYIDPPTLSISNINVGEKAQVTVNVQSFGTEDIDNLFAEIGIFDLEGDKLVMARTDAVSLLSLQKTTLGAEIDTSDLLAGEYKGKATVFFDDQNQETNEAFFKVGELTVDVVNYTKEVFSGQINKFDVIVESGWNNPIDELFVEVRMLDGEVEPFRTVSTTLKPWETKIITGFLDATSLDSGEYDIEMLIHYEGKTTLVEGTLLVKGREGTFSSTLIVVIFVVILIALTNIFWFFKLGKKKLVKKGSKSKKTPYGFIFKK